MGKRIFLILTIFIILLLTSCAVAKTNKSEDYSKIKLNPKTASMSSGASTCVGIGCAISTCAMCSSVCLNDVMNSVTAAVDKGKCMIDFLGGGYSNPYYASAMAHYNNLRSMLSSMQTQLAGMTSQQACNASKDMIAQLDSELAAYRSSIEQLSENRPPSICGNYQWQFFRNQLGNILNSISSARGYLSSLLSSIRCCPGNTTAGAGGTCILAGGVTTGGVCLGGAIASVLGGVGVIGYYGYVTYDTITQNNAYLGWAQAEYLLLLQVQQLQAQGWHVLQGCSDGITMVQYVNNDPNQGISAVQVITCTHLRDSCLPSCSSVTSGLQQMSENPSCKPPVPAPTGPVPQPSENCGKACMAINPDMYIGWGLIQFAGLVKEDGDYLDDAYLIGCSLDYCLGWEDGGLNWYVFPSEFYSDCEDVKALVDLDPTESAALAAVDPETGECTAQKLECCPYD